ncbi:MAG TPA: preprotein translocase subunit SecA, partial [Vicinamibacteria bacterium]|nr:preprotein translocase subunit SecA [Vicinamibacteria bacterium]
MSPRDGLRERLARLRGSTVVHDLTELQEPSAAVGRLGTELQALGDDALTDRAQALRAEARSGSPLDAIQVPAYALVREVARRTL